MPLRKKTSLGYTPTGAAMPTECTQYGTRMIEEQGGYSPILCPLGPDCYDIIDAVTGQVVVAKVKGKSQWLDLCSQFGYTQGGQSPPTGVQQQEGQCIEPSPTGSGGCRDVIPCPKGPAVSNNPNGAAAPGQGRRYTLVDYKTGELIKADVGDEIWTQYSVSSLPDAWVCDDPRCKPYCGTKPAETPSCPGVQEMDYQAWQDLVLKQKIEWENGGKKTLVGGPVRWKAPDGKTAISQYCYWPDGTSGEVPTNMKDGCPISCQEIYDQQHPAQQPAQPTPQPTPKPPSGEGMVPISIDIQAFTPGGMGPIPAQPLMQPRPAVPAPAPAPVPKAAAPPPPPPKPVEKKLDTGSAVGIGAFLVAIGAAAFFGSK